MIICTIEKTGTHSLRHYPHDAIYHCGDEALAVNDDMMTTYRDPMRTAASWRNASPQMLWRHNNWRKQWECWGKIIERGARVFLIENLPVHYNRGKDSLGLHQLLDAGDLVGFFREIPREDIDYAYSVAKKHGFGL